MAYRDKIRGKFVIKSPCPEEAFCFQSAYQSVPHVFCPGEMCQPLSGVSFF